MGSKTATSNRNAERQANTAALMSNIMAPGAGEISKKREAELQAAANFGRGVQFKPGSPYVGGDNVFRIDPATGEKKRVMRTGTTAADFTGNIIANQPTVGELFGDIGRGLMGGQADTPQFNLPTSRPGTPTQDFANMLPTPQRSEGIIPALLNTGGIGGLALNIIQDLFGKGKNFLFPEEEEEDTFSSAADAMGGAAVSIPQGRGFVPEGFTFPTNIQREAGPTVDSRTPTIEERVTTPVSQTGETTDQGVYETGSNLLGVGPEMGVFNVPGDRGSGFTPALETYYNNLIEQGVSPEEALKQTNVLSAYGYKDGGLTKTVAPQEGPMSAGVASLFKNK